MFFFFFGAAEVIWLASCLRTHCKQLKVVFCHVAQCSLRCLVTEVIKSLFQQENIVSYFFLCRTHLSIGFDGAGAKTILVCYKWNLKEFMFNKMWTSSWFTDDTLIWKLSPYFKFKKLFIIFNFTTNFKVFSRNYRNRFVTQYIAYLNIREALSGTLSPLCYKPIPIIYRTSLLQKFQEV